MYQSRQQDNNITQLQFFTVLDYYPLIKIINSPQKPKLIDFFFM